MVNTKPGSAMAINKQKIPEAQTTCSSCNALNRLQGAQYFILLTIVLLVVAPGGSHGLNIPQFRMGDGGPQIPPSRNCTGKECEEVSKHRDKMMRHRFATIYQTFIQLPKKPKTTQATTAAADFPESQIGPLIAEVSEIVSFAEEVLGKFLYIVLKLHTQQTVYGRLKSSAYYVFVLMMLMMQCMGFMLHVL